MLWQYADVICLQIPSDPIEANLGRKMQAGESDYQIIKRQSERQGNGHLSYIKKRFTDYAPYDLSHGVT